MIGLVWSEYPGCCKGVVVQKFGHYPKCPLNKHTPSAETLKNEIEARLVHFKSVGQVKFVTATLTTPQGNGVPGQVLRELGFKRTRLGKNNHNHVIWLYKKEIV